MKSKVLALRIAGTIFGIVTVLHLLRVITGVSIMIGGWMLPLWVNCMGFVGAGLLCGWLWRLSGRKE